MDYAVPPIKDYNDLRNIDYLALYHSVFKRMDNIQLQDFLNELFRLHNLLIISLNTVKKDLYSVKFLANIYDNVPYYELVNSYIEISHEMILLFIRNNRYVRNFNISLDFNEVEKLETSLSNLDISSHNIILDSIIITSDNAKDFIDRFSSIDFSSVWIVFSWINNLLNLFLTRQTIPSYRIIIKDIEQLTSVAKELQVLLLNNNDIIENIKSNPAYYISYFKENKEQVENLLTLTKFALSKL
jgi:hypothetical protein